MKTTNNKQQTINVIRTLLTLIILSLSTNKISAQLNAFETLNTGATYVFNDINLKIQSNELFTKYKQEFGLNEASTFKELYTRKFENDKFVTKYQQYVKGYPIFGSIVNVLGQCNIVQRVTGKVYKNITIEGIPAISEISALEKALSQINAIQYTWQDSTREANIKENTNNPNATSYPVGLLTILRKRGEPQNFTDADYRLVWKFTIESIIPAAVYEVDVDATTNQIINFYDPTTNAYHVVGTVNTWYDGWKNISTQTCSFCINYKLRSDRNINTYHSDGASDWKDGDNSWGESSPDVKTPASAHWAVGETWNYYFNRHGQWASDHYGCEVNIKTDIVELSAGGVAGYMFEDGIDKIGIQPRGSHNPASAFDIMAHEYTHAFVRKGNGLGLDGSYQSKALNEGIADIHGYCAERYILGVSDWLLGEDYAEIYRRIDHPENDFPLPSPTKYSDLLNTNYHRDSGVLRKWFYLLANGGSQNGWTVNSLGIEKADDISYIMFNWWLWSSANYHDCANQTIQEAIYTWGECSEEHKQIARAWNAVGIAVPIPFCRNVIVVQGPDAVANGDRLSNPIIFTASIDEMDKSGIYTWETPIGWDVRFESDKMYVYKISNTNSVKLKVKFTASDGETIYAEKVVHVVSNSSTTKTALSSESIIHSYPNPCENILYLDINTPAANISYTIYNTEGKIIIDNKELVGNSIAVQELPVGLYFIQLILDNKVEIVKFIKK